MKISLGPIYFYWSKQETFDFYDKIEKSAVDIVYLGEVVCSKRHQLKLEDWLVIAKRLSAAGKEVALSTLTLLEADSELKRLERICKQNDYLVEANDFAAINLLSKQKSPFVVGPSVNMYNSASLSVLTGKGLARWCLPVELAKDTLQAIMNEKKIALEAEVFVFGKLPLSFSARCFSARAYNLDKDDCRYKCIEHKDGLLLSTQEEESFLVMNGIQTMSAASFNLIKEIDDMQALGVDVVRISPQYEHTDHIIQIFKDRINNNITTDQAEQQLTPLSKHGQCDGYWFEKEGMGKINLEQLSAL
ncbi:MAG: U32 family peptidase [Candidatus Thioglobus sp.]|jgi:collagenase-like PrtC family protease|nr:U32 family peptidase [Candidatus Thioglobus sp.]MBT3965186.1 U32 family peptidase [Candidatus Thioglobus sp.]MBT5286212.1 U32 family peptidase [Candidatus Thioglobus sp.]MBT6655018.1 U32 family peptidase [Candidatus Thioglobus sp.]MBT7002859.1 U32 family peptidase [Candidatus Thioglobus sp.]